MAIDAYPALGIGVSAGGIKLILPKAAAEDGCLVGIHNTYADAAKLRIAATRNNGCALRKSGLSRGGSVYGADNSAALRDRWEDIVLQTYLAHDGRIPCACV